MKSLPPHATQPPSTHKTKDRGKPERKQKQSAAAPRGGQQALYSQAQSDNPRPGRKPLALTLLDSSVNSNDPCISLEWSEMRIGTDLSRVCRLTADQGHSITARITQGAYRKSFKGAGTLMIGPVPVGGEGVRGQLQIINDSTGSVVVVEWCWQPQGIIDRAMSSDLMRKLSGRRKGKAETVPETADAKQKQAISAQTAPAAEATTEIRFFGIHARGGCFAFILDISLSMQGARLEYCKRELIQALKSLPETASFGIFLYADTVYTPRGQKDWLTARADVVDDVVKWVSGIVVKPYTRPGPAFRLALSYSSPPGVIYFLTDGELFGFTAGDCARITGAGTSLTGMLGKLFTNRKPRPVPVIHTIALGDEAGTAVLRTIADHHGGSCRAITSI